MGLQADCTLDIRHPFRNSEALAPNFAKWLHGQPETAEDSDWPMSHVWMNGGLPAALCSTERGLRTCLKYSLASAEPMTASCSNARPAPAARRSRRVNRGMSSRTR